MNIQEARERFQWLEAQLKAGSITEEQYLAQAAALRVADEQGRWWAIEAHSGAWLTYDGEKWVPSVPPAVGAPAQPAAASQPPHRTGPLQSAPAKAAPAQPAAPGGKPRKKRGLFIGVAAIGLIVLCLCAVVAGLWTYGDQLVALVTGGGLPSAGLPAPAGEVEDTPLQVELKPAQSLPVTPGGAPVSDDRGTSLSAAGGSVEQGVAVQMEVSEGSGELVTALKQNFTLSPFYEVTASGANDGTDPAALSFNASDPNARVAAVVDGKYLAVMDIPPDGGKITVQADINPQETGSEQVESMAPGGSIAYILLTPTQAGSSTGAPSGGALMAPAAQADPRRCTPDVSHRAELINYCRQNAAKTIQIMVPASIGLTEIAADMLVDYTETIMLEYQRLGFTNAVVTTGRPLRMVVNTGTGDPQYTPGNRTLYIPKDTALAITDPAHTHSLQHELAHFIQHRKYNMVKTYWGAVFSSGSGKWWIENSADNMVFLLDPAYMNEQIVSYGAPAPALGKMGFQYAPLQWNDELYIHAHLVKLFMCADSAVCPLSEQTFIAAVNNGTYPYDEAAVARVSANLDEYARYVLASAPKKGNTAIPLPAPSGPYTEKVDGGGKTLVEILYDKNGFAPQLAPADRDGQKVLKIEAAVEKAAIYPLFVSNNGSKTSGSPTLPLMITIEPGLPFYYRLDDGEPIFNNGSSKTVLGPVHRDMGLKNVRIVAIARETAGTFKAEIAPVDLQGDWVFYPTRTTGNSVVCEPPDEDSEGVDTEGLGSLSVILNDLYTIQGTFKYDPTDHSVLNLEYPAGAVMNFDGGESIQAEYTGSATANGKEIIGQIKTTIPKSEASRGLPWAALAVTVVPGGLALGARPGRRTRAVFTGIVIAGMLLGLAGCVDIYGSFTGNYNFKTIAAGEGKTIGELSKIPYWTEAVPTWVLKDGTGSADLDIYIVTAGDIFGEGEDKVQHCTGSIDFAVEGVIVPDGTITSYPDFNTADDGDG